METVESLEAIETVFAQHRGFGDSNYIHEQLQAIYQRRLRRLTTRLPGAEQLLDTLHHARDYTRYRVLGDPVVRCAIQHALVRFETDLQNGLPLEVCQEIIQETVLYLERGGSGSPLESGAAQVNRLGSEPCYGWVWTEEHSDDVLARAFRYMVLQEYGGYLCAPTANEFRILAQATKLLGVLVPKLSRSALSHAHVVAVFPAEGDWKGKASSSQFALSGVFFINRERLSNPWWVAEHILHESLHQKLYDFRSGHLFYSPVWREVARVRSWWNAPSVRKSNLWNTDRAVAAFHVYVHLSLLCLIAERRESELKDDYGSLRAAPAMTESRQALERAHYLGEKIEELCWQELGAAGQGLINWLLAVLEELDPSPPPKGAYLHLLLDRYQREANRVALVLSRRTAPISSYAFLVPQLRKLAKDETDITRRVLFDVNAGDYLSRFETALADYPDEDLGPRFPEVRALIAKVLLNASREGYGLRPPSQEASNLDIAIVDMVERSSSRLGTILAE